MSSYPFCNIEEQKILSENDLAKAIPDGFPVTEGHTLIIARRHEPDFLGLTSEELVALWELAVEVAYRLLEGDPRITGFNMGPTQGSPLARRSGTHIGASSPGGMATGMMPRGA